MILVSDRPKAEPEKDVTIGHNDMEMIKRIKDVGLYIDAVKVARLVAKCSLLTAKNFVDTL